ncbi:MAG TPA: porin family protein [Bacteroidia bacterium]|nr:porin family protein [Bacteroidia bacterium]
MKKTLLVFMVTSFVCVFSARSQFRIGPAAGLNIATLSGTELTVDSKVGWHGGLFFDFSLTKHFSVMAAALYSTKGYKYEFVSTTSAEPIDTASGTATITATVDVNATLGYLDIPVLLTWYSGEHKGFMIQAGPQLSYLITDNSKVNTTATISENGQAPQPTTPTTSNKLEFHKTDVSLVGGIGYKLPALLMVYARASTGFAKVQDGNFIKDQNAGNNFVISLGAALVFGAK